MCNEIGPDEKSGVPKDPHRRHFIAEYSVIGLVVN